MGSQHRWPCWLFWQPAISTFACGNKVLFCSVIVIEGVKNSEDKSRLNQNSVTNVHLTLWNCRLVGDIGCIFVILIFLYNRTGGFQLLQGPLKVIHGHRK